MEGLRSIVKPSVSLLILNRGCLDKFVMNSIFLPFVIMTVTERCMSSAPASWLSSVLRQQY